MIWLKSSDKNGVWVNANSIVKCEYLEAEFYKCRVTFTNGQYVETQQSCEEVIKLIEQEKG